MKPESGTSLSLWAATAELPEFNSLDQDIETEICVIGAGITGITAAYLLLLEGKQVVIIEDGNICSGETSRTTAHITNVIDDHYYVIERIHGKEAAVLAAKSQNDAIKKIKEIIQKNKIECDFSDTDGYLFFKPDENDIMEKEYDAVLRAGIKAEKCTSPVPAFEKNICIRFPGQCQFHALKYLNGIVRSFIEKGGRIYTHTHASSVKDGDTVEIKTSAGNTIIAKDTIVATNSPISDYFKMHIKQAAYRTYVIGAKVPKGSIKQALYWDNEEPYHYVRIQKEEKGNDAENYDVLIVGGEDHKTGQEDDAPERYTNLETWARERFPMMGEIEYKWSGQVLEPIDGLSFIGLDPENPQHTYISTGDSGMGMTHGTFSSILLTDMIMGRENEWGKIYDPSRLKFLSLDEMASEGINTAAQFIDYITQGDLQNADELKPGEGAIIRRGLYKFAVYKDKNGNVSEFSAACTHLKCILDWNSSEKTWDCPCHGSRFSAEGEVINGPALTNMKKTEHEIEEKISN